MNKAGIQRIDWPSYHQLIEDLSGELHRSNVTFDLVLAIARGGLRVGDVISRIFDRPLAVISASSYRADQGTQPGKLQLGTSIALCGQALEGSVLIVDDMVDSGTTLAAVTDFIMNQPKVTCCQTAVLWWKVASTIKPDFYACKLHDDRWIEQPFEHYDRLGRQIFSV